MAGLNSGASTSGYAEAAEVLVEQYESVTFADVHGEALALYPERPSSVLDIGAGSGRDAAALSALGHTVVAVEPTAELRERGRVIHAARPVEWLDDELPELRAVRASGRRFDLVLLTAVWMHLDEDERAAGMETLGRVTAPGGLVVLTLRHGPVPAGRRMFDVSVDETVGLAREQGLSAVHLSGRADLHGRSGVRWSTVGLRRAP
ncbi:bifunctional 2-polyprenyl-6-hydroxyphenol methylase/3-demethylubiquinol 3-O-methyltransferase UbiG [Streptomyces sp. NBC_00102]|uniref:class I SAM-dependent methyltransferase n=1 Tax=Streptomyces sp. NBC_00102 TaxID=2975652 RepID=UPI0022559752|nr:class I SAM-dependent methyltransferase [Streptomyces sp. NBC_00102]MCX5397888.1 class I SAM-dependent methyltransferase [Streptomyces sp. NBC_00102]